MRMRWVTVCINFSGKLVDQRLRALLDALLLLCLLILNEAGELSYLLLQRLHLRICILILQGGIVTDCPDIHAILVCKPGNGVLRVFLQIFVSSHQLPDRCNVIHARPCECIAVRRKNLIECF